MAETINTRNERLNACHIPEPTPAINYLNAVRRHRGQQDAEIDTAAAELTPATVEMINGNYAQVLAGNAQTAFEEAIVISEALMFEGAQALPSYHPERDVPDRPPGYAEDGGRGVEENVPTGRLPDRLQISCNAFLRILKTGDMDGAQRAYTHIEEMCGYQLGTSNFHDNVIYFVQQLAPPERSQHILSPLIANLLRDGRNGKDFKPRNYLRYISDFEKQFGELREEAVATSTAMPGGSGMNDQLSSDPSSLDGFSSLERELRPDEELARLILNTDQTLDEKEIAAASLFAIYEKTSVMEERNSLFRLMWEHVGKGDWSQARTMALVMEDTASHTSLPPQQAILRASITRKNTTTEKLPDAPDLSLRFDETGDCEVCCVTEDAPKTRCCSQCICLGCFSEAIEEKKKQDLQAWINRGQMIECLGCNKPIKLGRHEQELTKAAQGYLVYFNQRYVAGFYQEHSDARPVFCADDNCTAAYNIDREKEYFQCNHLDGHADQRIRLNHVNCENLWTLDHNCPMTRKRLLEEEIVTVTNMIEDVDNIRRCPGTALRPCKSPIYKDGGCLHMHCRQCGADYCWACEKTWLTHGGGYYNCAAIQETREVKERRLRELRVELNTLQAEYQQLTGATYQPPEENPDTTTRAGQGSLRQRPDRA